MAAAMRIMLVVLLGAVLVGSAVADEPKRIDAELEAARAKAGSPALAAAITKGGRILAMGITGRRRADRDDLALIGDRFHLGSDTKAMTALAAAILIEGRSPIPLKDGARLTFDTTVGEVFPELVPTMVPGFAGITLHQLLSHTSGIHGDDDRYLPFLGFDINLPAMNPDELRASVVKTLVTMPLAHEPGTAFEYANFGYILAGAMLERLTGRTWEELVVALVFEPLALGSAGLGSQAEPTRMEAAVGHDLRDGAPFPILFGPYAGLPSVMFPAGAAYMSVVDFARWADFQATRGTYGPSLVAAETLALLQTGVVDMPENATPIPGFSGKARYGLGWGITTADFAPEPVILHAGSNSLNLAFVMLLPEEEVAIVTMANVEGPGTAAALAELSAQLYETYGKAP
jgi:CubicO group peptidase (beta-lactamase class C family)